MTPSIRQQLQDAGRVIDMRGGNLKLEALKEAVYYLSRNRDARLDFFKQSPVDVICSDQNAKTLSDSLKAEMDAKYGTFHVIPHTHFIKEQDGPPAHTIVDIPECGCKLAIFASSSLYDKPDCGDSLWLLDLSDIGVNLLSGATLVDTPKRHLIIANVGGIVIE